MNRAEKKVLLGKLEAYKTTEDKGIKGLWRDVLIGLHYVGFYIFGIVTLLQMIWLWIF